MTTATETSIPAPLATAGRSYIDEAETGNGSGVRYVLGSIFILATWLIGGSILALIVTVVMAVLQGGPVTAEGLLELLSSPSADQMLPNMLILMSTFWPFTFAIWLVTRFLHNRPFRSLITWRSRINWGRVGIGFGVWLLLSVVSTGADVLLRPEQYTWQPNWGAWLPYAILSLILVPIQASTEELFFRGYLMQASSKISRNFFVLILPSSFLFMLLHILNEEVGSDPLLLLAFYLSFGLFAAFLSVKDGTTELAIGAHVANNLYGSLAATFPESSLPSPAPLLKASLEPALDLGVFVVLAVAFYLIVFYALRRFTPREQEA